MSLGTVRVLPIDPALRDEIDEIKDQGLRKYLSPWVRIQASASFDFPHGLNDIPHVSDVLEATDSQGSGAASASSVTVTKTGTIVRVVNSGSARYFRVRAF